eukprot:Mrub_11194.p1 GENE.Mrub_11194~~Mrub_11194.p1  ORF type:complete len:177 (+),score=27.93 Mrub_11194:76-531(+)
MIKDIIYHINNIINDNNKLQKLSFEYFCRNDTEGSGAIASKDLMHVFGCNFARKNLELESSFFYGSDVPNSIDKNDFYKYVKIALDILKNELVKLIKDSIENSVYSQQSKGIRVNEDELIVKTINSISESIQFLEFDYTIQSNPNKVKGLE